MKIKPDIDPAGQMRPTSENKVFCTAPWVHTYISPQSERRLCCVSKEDSMMTNQYLDAGEQGIYASSKNISNYKPATLKDHFHSPYMNEIRRRIMAGEEVPQCEVCNYQKYSFQRYREWFNMLFHHKIDECFEKTNADGSTTMEPISFDYRVSNLCNFKCRMCGEQFSSTWEAEIKKNEWYDPEEKPYLLKENKKIIETFQIDVVEEELWDAACKGSVEEIYWAGGEPLMYPIHWRVMERLDKDDTLKNVFLRYNTNLSKVRFGNKCLYDYLPKAKDYQLFCSMDATGKVAEFIRTGLVWEQWDKNFREGVALAPGSDKMKIDLTLTLPGLLDLVNLVEYAEDVGVAIAPSKVFAMTPDVILSVNALPRYLRNRLVKEVLDKIYKYNDRQHALITELEGVLNEKTFDEEFPDTYQESFVRTKEWHQEVAEFRQDGKESITIEEIYSRDQEVLDWYNEDRIQG